MDCEQIKQQLSEQVDQPLANDLQAAVEAHLAECAECRAFQESLQALDSKLHQAFREERRRADNVVEQSIEKLRQQPEQHTPLFSSGRVGWGYLASMAAGFLLAAFLFAAKPEAEKQPAIDNDDVTDVIIDSDASPAPTSPPIAYVSFATGPISTGLPSTESSSSTTVGADQQRFVFDAWRMGCNAGDAVRTPPGTLCEVETSAGCRIRMNEQTEVVFQSPVDVELKQGQVWCSSPDDATLRVVAQKSLWSNNAETTNTESTEETVLPVFSCPQNSTLLASGSSAQGLEVCAAVGTVEFTVANQTHSLATGNRAEVTDQDVTIAEETSDLLAATRWMQPLLTLKGHGDEELTSRVDAMLAGIGRSKLSYLHEREIRTLGEYGALPLLNFVQSTSSENESARRQRAMRILADVAPVWMVPDLIRLFGDPDRAVGNSAALALARLTGEPPFGQQNPFPEGDAERTDLADRFQRWWAENGSACPVPPVKLATIPSPMTSKSKL